jgi:hypothetical protein
MAGDLIDQRQLESIIGKAGNPVGEEISVLASVPRNEEK